MRKVSSYVRGAALTHDPQQARLYDQDPLICKDISTRLLLDLDNGARRLLRDRGKHHGAYASGSGGPVPDDSEQAMLEQLGQQHPGGTALLLRKLEPGERWDRQSVTQADQKPSSITFVFVDEDSAPPAVRRLLGFLKKECVEAWPRFIWPYLDGRADHYRLSVLSPESGFGD